MDFQRQTPIDFLNSRREDQCSSYFSRRSRWKSGKKVKACSFDMYDTYRTVMKKCFPNSIGIVDRFHLCQELGRQTDSVRIRAMKGTTKGSDEYYLLQEVQLDSLQAFRQPTQKMVEAVRSKRTEDITIISNFRLTMISARSS